MERDEESLSFVIWLCSIRTLTLPPLLLNPSQFIVFLFRPNRRDAMCKKEELLWLRSGEKKNAEMCGVSITAFHLSPVLSKLSSCTNRPYNIVNSFHIKENYTERSNFLLTGTRRQRQRYAYYGVR